MVDARNTGGHPCLTVASETGSAGRADTHGTVSTSGQLTEVTGTRASGRGGPFLWISVGIAGS